MGRQAGSLKRVLLVGLTVGSLGFAAGMATGFALWHAHDTNGVAVSAGTSPWIEVRTGNHLISEWRPSDGQMYRCLRYILDDAP